MQWTFPIADSGQIKGINDEGVERFKSDPIKSLAREICQNSLDARCDDTKPVSVEFAEFEAEFPGAEAFQKELMAMLDYWKPLQKNDKSGIAFLTNAIAYLENSKQVSFLRISDSNTMGLTGVNRDGSPWDNLVMRIGASDKSASAGGSRGIGKAAPFAVSALRTVFYTTRSKDEENPCGFQGVARLMGYKCEDERIMTGMSFYGAERSKAALEYKSLAPSYERPAEQTGTDIFIAGFNQKLAGNGWESEILRYAVDSFFYAIFHGQLEITTNGYKLSSDKLQEFIKGEDENRRPFDGHAEQYYNVLTSNSDRAKMFTKEITDEGRQGTLKLWLLVDNAMSCRSIAMVRNTGMKIYDLKRFASGIQFAGVLVAEGDQLNHYLKNMEDATHEGWFPNNAENPKEAKAFLGEIRRFCQDSLHSLTQVNDKDEIDSGLGDRLPLTGGAENKDDQNNVEALDPTYRKITVEHAKKRKKSKPSKAEASDDEEPTEETEEPVPTEEETKEPSGGGKPERERGGGGERSAPDHPGNEEGDAPTTRVPKKKPITLDRFKTLCTDSSSGRYRVVFTPTKSMENGHLDLKMVTMTGEDVNPVIIDAQNAATGQALEVKDNTIAGLTFVKGEKQAVVVTLDYKDYGSMKGEAYGLA